MSRLSLHFAGAGSPGGRSIHSACRLGGFQGIGVAAGRGAERIVLSSCLRELRILLGSTKRDVCINKWIGSGPVKFLGRKIK